MGHDFNNYRINENGNDRALFFCGTISGTLAYVDGCYPCSILALGTSLSLFAKGPCERPNCWSGETIGGNLEVPGFCGFLEKLDKLSVVLFVRKNGLTPALAVHDVIPYTLVLYSQWPGHISICKTDPR